jgi:succinate-semialdehyde dehydrogenase / glutarate-semialdehyde dehydrogenase
MTFTSALSGHIDPASSLLADTGFIDGQWTRGAATTTFEVRNPATGDTIAHLPDMGACDARLAIDAAHTAQALWAAKPAKDRSTILHRWYQLICDNIDDLAAILTLEMGKPLAEARGEIAYAASYVEWFGEEAKRIYGEIIPAPTVDRRLIVLRQPVGVVGAITPWNFPAAMITRKVAPALAVGCTVVSKPSELTPLSALALAKLSQQAGIPPGVFNVVIGKDGPGIGRELCTNTKVRKISFTGSTQVGRLLMRQCADQIKKVSLELGGNAPLIVFDDADVDLAVEGAIASKYRNAGQTCVCANRIYVQAGIYDAFAERLTAQVRTMTVGHGFAPDVMVGPLIDDRAIAKVEIHIADALEKGAVLLAGGRRIVGEGTFFAPTVLSVATSEMKISTEETFGPVAALFRFDTVDDVIHMANDTEFGLAAYLFSTDIAKIWHVAEALQAGMVGVNTGLISSEAAPFGGMKQSGLGREGSRHGVDEYLSMKYVCIGGL